MRKLTISIFLVTLSLFIASCGKDTDRTELIPGPAGAQGAAGQNGTDGIDGKNGLNSLVSTQRFTSNTAICLSGAGVVINSGLDADANGVLDNSEITNATVVCDGIQGATGSTGAAGNNGSNGSNGSNGKNSIVKILGANLAMCPNSSPDGSGNYGQVIYSGLDTNSNGILDASEVTNTSLVCNGAKGSTGSAGNNGSNGTNGTNGTNGVSCTVTPIVPSNSVPAGGALLQCGLTQVAIYNGAASGAAQMYQVVQEIHPCGIASSPWKEVLLQLLGGNLIGDFSENGNALTTRLSDIPDGSYEDTDDSGCNFSVSTSGSTRSVSWAAGHNSYSTWAAQTISFPIY